MSTPTLDNYPPGDVVGLFYRFNVYACPVLDPDDNTGMLKIGTSIVMNPSLDREAFILQVLAKEAASVEASYKKKFPTKDPMNYHLLFPVVEANFLAEDQGGRRVLILKFPSLAQDRLELVPLSNITDIDQKRVDPKSSAWILGKLLKMLVFTHSVGVSIGSIDATKIIIHPKNHLVAVFDWSEAILHPGTVPNEIVQVEIREIARVVFNLLGGNFKAGKLPLNDQLVDTRYQEHIMRLIQSPPLSALEAHSNFYTLIRPMWGATYHPFTTHPL